ncbi:hypothetical protein [Clostridium sp.]|uniref:hypothetical protein n=1 Tax=Clostridium sp. TaxID=1506 RepID=UPI003216D4DB
MEKKEFVLRKEDCKLVAGKLVIESEELANMVDDNGLDLFSGEEAGLIICYKCPQ